MKVNEKLSVLFLLEKSKMSKDGKVPITARLTIGGVRAEFSLGAKVVPEYWDQEKEQAVLANNPEKDNARMLNNKISGTLSKLQTHYLILEHQYGIVSPLLLKLSYQGKLKDPKEQEDKALHKTLCQVFNFKYSKFARLVKAKKRSNNTLKRWATTKRKIREFLRFKFKKWDIPVSEVEYSLADDFLNYLVLHHNIEENTARKYLKNTKHVLKISAERKWIQANPWSTYYIGYDQPDREYLNLPEILAIYNKSFIPRLDHVRNIFLFACFTGYAFQEVLNLTRDDLFVGNDGKRWIMIDRHKTGEPEGLPLLPIASAIVDRYESDPYCIANNRLLPVKSYQNYNGYLKEVADICNINKNLSTHVARHTFATTVCLDHDVPLETVGRMLGHRNIRTTQIYARITKKKISDNMAALESKLFTNDGKLVMPQTPIVIVHKSNAVFNQVQAV